MGFMETGGARKGQLSVRTAAERNGDGCRGPRHEESSDCEVVFGARWCEAGQKAGLAGAGGRTGKGGSACVELAK